MTPPALLPPASYTRRRFEGADFLADRRPYQRRRSEAGDEGERELACEDEGSVTGDDEPWLGAPEGAQGYGNARCGAEDDREMERSPADPDDDPGEYVERIEVGLCWPWPSLHRFRRRPAASTNAT